MRARPKSPSFSSPAFRMQGTQPCCGACTACRHMLQTRYDVTVTRRLHEDVLDSIQARASAEVSKNGANDAILITAHLEQRLESYLA